MGGECVRELLRELLGDHLMTIAVGDSGGLHVFIAAWNGGAVAADGVVGVVGVGGL